MIIAAIFNKVFRRRKPLPKLIDKEVVEAFYKAQQAYEDGLAARLLKNSFITSYTKDD